uniref:Reverse transcriptase domain-containing protein n=1 Tax=Haplochromis burtoni TaxID=8153 RepID=A0A3Q3CXU9_HAPBU
MCFVDLEKAFDSVPQVVLWGVLREYGVSLLRAIQSLYDHYKSLFCIAGNKLDSFLVGDGLRQGCPLSLILFIIFMDRISRRSQVAEGFHFGGLRISSLLFTDDVVLLASSGDGLQFALERFAAECEAVGMRITTSKSEATVLSRKKVECPLRVRDETLPQMEEFKYLGVLFTSDGKREREIDRWIGAVAALMRRYTGLMAGLSLRDRVRTQSLEMPALSITLEYYTPQEMVGFKKTNHRVKKTWKKEKKSIADDLHLNDTCSSDFGSRTRGRGLKQENDEDQEVKKEEKVVMHEIHLLSGDIRMTEMDISDNEEFTPPEHAVIEEDEVKNLEQHFFFNATSEFCRILGDIPTCGLSDDAGVHLDHEQNQPDFATACATILDEEPIVNSGLVAALLLCKNKGLLDTQVQKVARVKCIEDKMGFDDKYSRREEYRGFMQDFKEDGCKPDVKIEYVEESGRKLTPKEGSGKMKTERRMKKLEVEALLKKMSSSDTTLGTVALLQERQKSQKTPSIVLGNSMNANTITK